MKPEYYQVVSRAESIQPVSIAGIRIGGVEIAGEAVVRPLLRTEFMDVIYLELEAGYLHSLHAHPDNESTGVVLSGKLEMRIGHERVELAPGDVWVHPRGIRHETRALRRTTAVEIHTPHRADYDSFFSARQSE